jgi:transcription initiation factor TFIID subunit TAF12
MCNETVLRVFTTNSSHLLNNNNNKKTQQQQQQQQRQIQQQQQEQQQHHRRNKQTTTPTTPPPKAPKTMNSNDHGVVLPSSRHKQLNAHRLMITRLEFVTRFQRLAEADANSNDNMTLKKDGTDRSPGMSSVYDQTSCTNPVSGVATSKQRHK